ncbi:hypothetical protein LTR62_002268 [Meristemomyces frigidus]|uniref:Acid phosphatase n=1 Tax=Meristemomyces frigidus TaxID=1508187 RepID=A0AAN7YLC6_9PEZI|nr:hypothetical protein LTR62_002268 [Meristemomyces frigidus]
MARLVVMALSGSIALLAMLLCAGQYASIVSAYSLLGSSRSLRQHVLGYDEVRSNKSADEVWDIRYHMGGNGPWIRKTHGLVTSDLAAPEGWVHMLELFQHIQQANVTLNGSLAFANDWDFFMKDPSDRLENLVATGPHAGTLLAFGTGVKMRTRYENLLEHAILSNQTSLWASGSKRVVETASYFAAGLFGLDWESQAHLHIIPETEDRGGDTLTGGKTCFKYLHNADDFGRQYGYRRWNEWREAYLPSIVQRLQVHNPEIDFTASELYAMQELCGFETIAKGTSEWCDVFTHKEWLQFEYARDLLHYYRTEARFRALGTTLEIANWRDPSIRNGFDTNNTREYFPLMLTSSVHANLFFLSHQGPGNPYSTSIGWLFLEATAKLLQQGPGVGTLFFSFMHDGDIIPMLTTLGLLTPEKHDLPTTHIPHGRSWRTSDLVSMGGRIIFERLVRGEPKMCWDHSEYGYPNHVYCTPSTQEHFVRINVNDGIVALPGCDSGPGRSCPLEQFLQRVRLKGEETGDFREVCGLSKTAKAGIDFLHQ